MSEKNEDGYFDVLTKTVTHYFQNANDLNFTFDKEKVLNKVRTNILQNMTEIKINNVLVTMIIRKSDIGTFYHCSDNFI